MLNVTKRKFGDKINNYICSSILNYKSQNKYDLILSTLADPFIIQECFTKFYNLLNDDGNIVFTFPSYDWANAINRAELNKTVFRTSTGHKLSSYSFCWSLTSIINMLKNSNYDIVRIEIIKIAQINNLSGINRNAFSKNKNLNFLTGIIAKKL